MSVSFVVFGAAAPAGSKVSGVTGSGRRFVRDSNPASKEWKRQVAQAAGEAMTFRSELGEGTHGYLPPLEGPLMVKLVVCRPRPTSHYGKRGLLPSAPAFPTTRPDVLKLARAVEDAMTGVVYRDDAQIVHEVLVKRYDEPTRVEVEVGPVPAEVEALGGGVGGVNRELLEAHRELMLLRTAAIVHAKPSSRRRRKRKGLAAQSPVVRVAYLRERERKLDEAMREQGGSA